MANILLEKLSDIEKYINSGRFLEAIETLKEYFFDANYSGLKKIDDEHWPKLYQVCYEIIKHQKDQPGFSVLLDNFTQVLRFAEYKSKTECYVLLTLLLADLQEKKFSLSLTNPLNFDITLEPLFLIWNNYGRAYRAAHDLNNNNLITQAQLSMDLFEVNYLSHYLTVIDKPKPGEAPYQPWIWKTAENVQVKVARHDNLDDESIEDFLSAYRIILQMSERYINTHIIAERMREAHVVLRAKNSLYDKRKISSSLELLKAAPGQFATEIGNLTNREKTLQGKINNTIEAHRDVSFGWENYSIRFRKFWILYKEALIENLANAQSSYVSSLKELLSDMLADSMALLGYPPCSFCLLSLGSLGTGEMFLGSDVEFALLIEQDQHVENPYFKNLLEIFNFKLLSVNGCAGLSVDESLNPLSWNSSESTNETRTFLRTTPSHLIQMFSHPEIEDGKNGLALNSTMAFALLSAHYLAGYNSSKNLSETTKPSQETHWVQSVSASDNIAFRQYQHGLEAAFSDVENVFIHRERALKRLQELSRDWKGQGEGAFYWGGSRLDTLDVKKHLLTPLKLLPKLLALYFRHYQAFVSNTSDALQKLTHPPEGKPLLPLSQAFSVAYQDALKAIGEYYYKTQRDVLEGKTVDHSDHNVLINTCYWELLAPLLAAIEHFLVNPSVGLFQDPPLDNVLPLASQNAWVESEIISRFKSAALTLIQRYHNAPTHFIAQFERIAELYWDALPPSLRHLFFNELKKWILPKERTSYQQQLCHLLGQRPQADGWREQTAQDQEKWETAIRGLFEKEVDATQIGALSKNENAVYLQIEAIADAKVVTYRLKREVIQQLFGGEQGLKKPPNDFFGRHPILPITQGGNHFCLKIRPEQPYIDNAVIRLNQRINGSGVCLGTVGHLHYPTSQGYESVPVYLMPNVRARKPLPYGGLRLPEQAGAAESFVIHPDAFTRTLLRTLLINPGDDRESDYYLSARAQWMDFPRQYDLIRIDNERAFYPGTYKRQLLSTLNAMWSTGNLMGENEGVQVGSIIYCLDMMYFPLSESVLHEFVRLDEKTLLNAWIAELQQQADLLRTLFPDKSAKEFFEHENQPSYLAFFLLENQIKELLVCWGNIKLAIHRHAKEVKMLQASGLAPIPALRGIDLFLQARPEIAVHYQKAFSHVPPMPSSHSRKGWENAEQRFSWMNAQHDFYKTIVHQGMTHVSASLAIRASHSRALDREITWKDIDDSRKGKKNSPLQALAIVNSIDLQMIQNTWNSIIEYAAKNDDVNLKKALQLFRQLDGTLKKMQLIKAWTKEHRLNPKSENIQRSVLQAMQGLPWVSFKGNIFAEVLTVEYLYPILEQAKDAQQHSTLLKLELYGCSKLKELVLRTPLSQLKVLRVRDCYRLQRVLLQANRLEELNFKRCKQLTQLRTSSRILSKVKMELLNSIREEDLARIAAEIKNNVKNGNASTQCSLGRLYRNGTGLPKNYKESIFWLQQAAAQGNAEAKFLLGISYNLPNLHSISEKLPQIHELHIYDYGSYHGGHGFTSHTLPYDVSINIGGPDFHYLQEAADQGSVEGQFFLGLAELDTQTLLGSFSPTKLETKANDNYSDEAIKWLQKAAKQGCEEAQFKLGLIYSLMPRTYYEDSIEPNGHEAVHCLKESAKQGYAEAQYFLALVYAQGHGGIEKSESEAFKWIQKAVEQENEGAITWLKESAEAENMLAQFYLGEMYYSDGQATIKVQTEALKWYTAAAKQGHEGAMARLCEMERYFIFPVTQREIGTMYLDGRGVKKDETKANEWLTKAAKNGDPVAKLHFDLDKWVRTTSSPS